MDLETEVFSPSELDAFLAEVNGARVSVCVHVRCSHNVWLDDENGRQFVSEASFDQTDTFKYGECANDPQNPSSVDMGGFGTCLVHLNVACDTDALTLGLNEAKQKAISDNRHRDEDCGAVHCCFLLSLLSDHTKSFNLRIGNDRVSGQLFICSDAQKRRIQRMRPWVLLSICTGTIGFLYWWFVDFNTGEVELNFKKVLLPGPLQNQQAQEPSQEDVAETWKRHGFFGNDMVSFIGQPHWQH